MTIDQPRLLQQPAGEYAKTVCKLFGYERMLPMNTGAEAVGDCLKMGKWG